MKQLGDFFRIATAPLLALSLSVLYVADDGQSIQPRVNSISDYTNQLIVKLHNPPSATVTLSGPQLRSLSASAGILLADAHAISGGAHVVKLPHRVTVQEAAIIAHKLNADPRVDYAEPDFVMRLMAADEVQYSRQWDYNAPDVEGGGIDLSAAWAVTTGSPDIVVAVIDSGILPHADFPGNILPGYDFISEDRPGVFLTANDGDGRDSDATDPGDWVTGGENAGKDATNGFFAGCGTKHSSWHGTHVAGTIAAASRNGHGVTGVNQAAKILPVRAWGKCGGYASDIVDSARWAAGLPVPGVPRNPHPAHILNMSLDGPGTCSISVQQAMNEIVDAGKVVIVSAGNRASDAAEFSPASCKGVITVAATDRAGRKAPYSNFGSVITISAPGGDTSRLLSDGVLSTTNSGKTAPVADNYGYKQGTSMAAPHVAGIVSLMLSVNPNLTPAQVAAALQTSARPFPTGTGADCTRNTCGAGIINAAAVGLVSRLLKLSTSTVRFGATELGRNTEAQTFTLTNTNTANIALTLGAISVAGAYAADFTKSEDTCSGNTIAPRHSCKVAIIFHPSAADTRTAELIIPSDAVNALNNIKLSGTGQILTPTTVATAPATQAVLLTQDVSLRQDGL
ncbi:MAG: S8 family serine peptidase [Gammaproteobacteria bacterium]